PISRTTTRCSRTGPSSTTRSTPGAATCRARRTTGPRPFAAETHDTSTDAKEPHMRTRSSLLIAIVALAAPGALAAPLCKPALSLNQYEVAPWPMPARTWTARIDVDASRCASASGQFDIDFVRGKTNLPDQRFTHHYAWTPGRVEVSMVLQKDELLADFS